MFGGCGTKQKPLFSTVVTPGGAAVSRPWRPRLKMAADPGGGDAGETLRELITDHIKGDHLRSKEADKYQRY